MNLIPEKITLMESLIVHEVLQRIKYRILTGRPSGQIIDQAIHDVIEQGATARPRGSFRNP